jgi:hypothetical protein
LHLKLALLLPTVLRAFYLRLEKLCSFQSAHLENFERHLQIKPKNGGVFRLVREILRKVPIVPEGADGSFCNLYSERVTNMANEPNDRLGDAGSGNLSKLLQHPLVARLKPDPSQPAKRIVDLTGLPGNSDRPGYERLYLTNKLDYYAEFLTSDRVDTQAVPAGQSSFAGPGQHRARRHDLLHLGEEPPAD